MVHVQIDPLPKLLMESGTESLILCSQLNPKFVAFKGPSQHRQVNTRM